MCDEAHEGSIPLASISQVISRGPTATNPDEIAPPKDFFIIYTPTDKAWAEWIAWCLEDAGYSIDIAGLGFPPR